MNRIAILIFPFWSPIVFGCSFYKYEEFPPSRPGISHHTQAPSSPRVEWTIKRAHLDGSNSCSDTGMISFVIPQENFKLYEVGYIFDVVESSIDQKVIPDVPLYGMRSEDGNNKYVFSWLENTSGILVPVKIVVNIYRVSINGAVSEPTKVTITHGGGYPH